MKYTFKGNFGTLVMTIEADGKASGTYQKNGALTGTWIENTFTGEWSNQGMEGLVTFSVSEGKLAGGWKKGKETGAMKGKWKGDVVAQEGEVIEAKTPIQPLAESTEAPATTASDSSPSPTDAISAEIGQLYDDENYAQVISTFEENEEVAVTDEDVVHKYLFSMWFHGDLEEKTFEKIREYEDTFTNYTRWNKLKGWYFSFLEYYDTALKLFKDSSERHYNRTKKIFDDFETLYDEEKYEEVIEYFETTLRKSISEDTYTIAEKYCQALYRNLGTEEKALKKVRDFIDRFPDHISFQSLEGKILRSKGYLEEDLDLLNEALEIFKRIDDKRNIGKTKEEIVTVKNSLKEAAYAERKAAREAAAEKKRQEAEQKRAEREAATAEKKAAKAAAEEAKALEHRFKTSRGLTFCQFCGEERQWAGSACHKRKAGHNFIMQKVGGDWEPVCNRCAQEAKWSGMDYCQ